MIRVVVVNLLLFLLPFVLFAVYMLVFGRRGKDGGLFDNAPLVSLTLAGVVLVVGMMSYFISFEGAEPGRPYIPPSFENGQINRGHTEEDYSSRRFAGPREPGDTTVPEAVDTNTPGTEPTTAPTGG